MSRFVLAGNNRRAYEDCTSAEILLAGPAGTGKTVANLLKVLKFGSDYPGARMLLVRKTRKSLAESAMQTLEDDLLGPGHPITPRPLERTHRHVYRFPNRSTIVVAGMDNPEKVLSTKWDLIYVNEATELTLNEWEQLGTRLRGTAGPYTQLVGDCNPGPPHHWLYKRTQTGKTRRYDTRHHENPGYYDAATRTWTDAGRRYLKRLKAATGIRYKRFYLGLWEAAEGLIYAGYVGRPWDDPELPGHLTPAGWTAPRAWRRVWSIDWGGRAPTVLQVWAVDPEDRMYLVREVYRTSLRPDSLGGWAAEQILHGEPEPEAVVCDHSPEHVEEFERGAKAKGRPIPLRPADKADRKEGISAVQARFDRQDDGRSRIFFRLDAVELPVDAELDDAGRPVSTLTELVDYKYDPKRLDDEPQEHNDHGMDAMRYAARYVDSGAGRFDLADQGGGDGLFRLYHERQAGGDGEFRSFYDRQGR